MSDNRSEPRYRPRQRIRADRDETPLQAAPEQSAEKAAENAEQQFSEHTALGTRAIGAGSADGQAGALAAADPAAQASLLAGMQQRHGNQHVQRVVQRLRVQRSPDKTAVAQAGPNAQPDSPKLSEALAAKYPHLARVLTTEQVAQWQKMIDAYTPWNATQKQMAALRPSLLIAPNGGLSGSSVNVEKYERLQRKSSTQAQAISENVNLEVPTELLLAPDVLDAGVQDGYVMAFHTRLYNRLVSRPCRVWLGGEVKSVDDFVGSPWPVHISSPVFEGELGSDGGLVHWQNLMRASQGLALSYQQVLLEAQKKTLGGMMEISARSSADDEMMKMREDIWKIRRILQNNIVSSGDEREMLNIVHKWADADAHPDEAVAAGLRAGRGGSTKTPLFDEFLSLCKAYYYDYKSRSTAWVGQTTTIYDGLWEEMDGSHYGELAMLVSRSPLGHIGRQTPKMESVWSYVGKREALAGWGIVSALGQGLTGLVDLGMWMGYRAAGGKGDAPAITPLLSKRQDRVAEAIAGEVGIDLSHEKGLFGLDPFTFARITGKVPAALMTAGAVAPLGELGVLIGGAQTLQQVDALADKIKKMRAAGKSWDDIFKDPQTWVQIVGVVAGAIGAAGGMAEAGTATKALLGQMGKVADLGQMELIAAAYYAVDDDQTLSGPEKNQRKADLLADFLSTGTMTIDKYGEAFKQRWEARYAEGVAKAGPAHPEPEVTAAKQEETTATAGGSAKQAETTAQTGRARDTATQGAGTGTETGPSDTETKTGGQAYTGKRPPPLPLNKKGFNQPVGEPLHTEAQGRAVMRRLADGDARALVDIGVRLPDNYNPIGREWGLGKTKDGKFSIIEGGTGGVDWEVLVGQGVEPLSHSHPLFKGREMTKPGVTAQELINGLNVADKTHVLPSVEDIMVCAKNGLKWHELQTPYAHLGDGRIGNYSGSEPGLSIIIHDAAVMGESPDFFFYKAQLEFVSGGQTLWKGEVWTWSNFVRGPAGFSTSQPEFFSHATPTPTEATTTGSGVPGMPSTTTTKAGVGSQKRGAVNIDWNKKLSASGNPGSLGAKAGYGVFEGSIAGVPHPVAIKVYAAKQLGAFAQDMLAAQVAAKTGQAARYYGEVDAGPGKLAFAMEKIEGGFPQNESLAQPGTPEYEAAEREGKFYASKITQQTVRDVTEYSRRLLDLGYYSAGEVQGLIDAQGRWKAIDFQGIRALPRDLKARQAAYEEHDTNIKAQIVEIENAAKASTP